MTALRTSTPLSEDFWRLVAGDFDPDWKYIPALRVAIEESPAQTVFRTASDVSLRPDTVLFFCAAFYGALEHPQWPAAFKDPASLQIFLVAVRNARRTVLQTPSEGWFPHGETLESFQQNREVVVGIKLWMPAAVKYLFRRCNELQLFTYGINDVNLLSLVVKQMKKLLFDKPHWADQKRHSRKILHQLEKKLASDREKFAQEVKETREELAERERKVQEACLVQAENATAIAKAATDNATELMKGRLEALKRGREIHEAEIELVKKRHTFEAQQATQAAIVQRSANSAPLAGLLLPRV